MNLGTTELVQIRLALLDRIIMLNDLETHFPGKFQDVIDSAEAISARILHEIRRREE